MDKKKVGRDNSGERFRLFQIEILAVLSALILIVTAFLDYVILKRSGAAMRENVSELIAANGRQLELNINSYFQRMETVSTLMFSDEDYYLYDETDSTIEEYDKVKSEENIKNRIVDIGLMENYSDFGIIYSDDHKVGWISHGTQDLFPDGGMYEVFSGYIVNDMKNDGWCFGINGNTDRMYYIKRLNPNAILVSSIYTRELSSVFIYPEQLDDMRIRMIDDSGKIVFSSVSDEIGQMLSEKIANELKRMDLDDNNKEDHNISTSIITDEYLINVNVCSNNWRVICSVPTRKILSENEALKSFTIRVSGCLAALFMFVGLFIVIRLSRPMDGMVSSLQERAAIDKLSGVMNKATFQEAVEARLTNPADNRYCVFVMLDMDNFKQVNDKLGHSYGDQVIIRVGRLLRRLYDTQTMIGRMGGDEFALYTECIDIPREEVFEAVTSQMDKVMEAFTEEFEVERVQCNVSISAGVYIAEPYDNDYSEVFNNADKALYESKHSGKSRYTFYKADM